MALKNDESIYDILYRPPPTPAKSPRYRATMRFEVEGKVPSKPCATIGPAELSIETPNQFLKKGKGIHAPVIETHLRQCLSSKHLPPVPKSPGKQKTQELKTKNFKLENIKRISKLKPSSACQRSLVDSPDGHKYSLDHYNLKYVYHKNFGQVPKYLKSKKNMIQKMKNDYIKEIDNKEPLCKQISAEEREELLNGLKKNREGLQKKFLLLPVLIDTIPKVNKKQKLEKQLRELEKDIDLLEKHPYIYICE